MTNREKYDKLFQDAFQVKPAALPMLKYRGLAAWDSVGHMDLMSSLEEAFKVNFSTLDVLDFTSYEKGKVILARYGVEL